MHLFIIGDENSAIRKREHMFVLSSQVSFPSCSPDTRLASHTRADPVPLMRCQ